MYWYYKAFLALIICAILGAIGFSFRHEISELIKTEEPIEEPVKTKPTEKSSSNSTKTSTPTKGAPSIKNPKTVKIETSYDFSKEFAEAKDALSKGQLEKAYEAALKVLDSKETVLFSKTWYQAADIASDVNTRLMNSSAPSPRKIQYVVKSGDALSRLARNKTTVQHIQKSNKIPLDTEKIFVGQSLRYFAGTWSIDAYKSEFVLIVKFNGKFFKYYRIGIGKEDRTPVAQFTIVSKIVEPAWEKGDGTVIQFGDPSNPLGTRWLQLKSEARPDLTGYGIHGTIAPSSIGKPSSQGCLRLKNSDVEELYDIIPYNVQVNIKE